MIPPMWPYAPIRENEKIVAVRLLTTEQKFSDGGAGNKICWMKRYSTWEEYHGMPEYPDDEL